PIDQQNIPSQEGSETDNVNSQQMIDPAEQAKSDAINMAKFFVEMIGTYSPGVQFQNVIDLQPMMTQKMVSWSEDFIKRNMETGEGVQERISTKVLKIEETKMAEGSAEIRVNTRRTRVDDAGQTNYSQEAEVELLKINGVWKVNNLIWK
ncbi:MAG TPA: hypothetical protein PLR18_02355, partial [bacterium]|nr:hypothetical protein [bacterium]